MNKLVKTHPSEPEINLKAAKRFLEWLDPKAHEFCFQTFGDGEKNKKRRGLIFQEHGGLSDWEHALVRLNKQGAAVCVTLNQTDGVGTKKRNIVRVRALLLDLDDAPLDPVLESDLPPGLVVETSPGRHHCYWRVEDGRDVALHEFEEVQTNLALKFNGDIAVALLTQRTRLPGFLHMKSEPFLVRVVKRSRGRLHDWETLVAHFSPPRREVVHHQYWGEDDDDDAEERPFAAGSRIILHAGDVIAAAGAFLQDRYPADGNLSMLQHHRGDYFTWTKNHWRKQPERNLTREMYEFFKDVLEYGNAKLELFKPNEHKLRRVAHAMQHGINLDERRDPPFWIKDEPPECGDIVVCRNGLLDINSRELRAHDPNFFNLHVLPFDYDPQAKKPTRWLRFLRELWPDDKDKDARMTLAELFGYLLTSSTSQQKIFMVVGPKRSGKGTMATVLKSLLGGNSVVHPTLHSLNNEFGLQPFIHKRLAIINDARLSGRSSVVVERLLTISGEDQLTINRKYKDHWTGKLGVRFLMLTNELPNLVDMSGALPSRFVIWTLEQSFYGKEDHELADKLLAELPGIFNWALSGLDRLNKRGRFQMPQSSLDAMRAMQELASPVSAFIRECCVVGPGKRIKVKVMYGTWKAWAEERGERADSSAIFGRNLRAAVPGLKPKGSGKKRYYSGITLNEIGRRKFDRVVTE